MTRVEWIWGRLVSSWRTLRAHGWFCLVWFGLARLGLVLIDCGTPFPASTPDFFRIYCQFVMPKHGNHKNNKKVLNSFASCESIVNYGAAPEIPA